MLYVIHALDKPGELPTRAKHYRDHRLHLDRAEDYNVDVITAGTLVADDNETPCGSVFVIDAVGRPSVERFVHSDPYHINGVWERINIHGYNKKRGTPIVSRRAS
jgi:uncharacterized protein YciI